MPSYEGQRGKRDAIGMETDRGRVGGDPCFDVEGRRSHGQVEERARAVAEIVETAHAARLRAAGHPLVRSLSARAGPPGIGRQNPRRLVLSPAHWSSIARTQTRIVHSPKAIFSQRVARTCRCVRRGASQSDTEGGNHAE